jgi:hypothetical protein
MGFKEDADFARLVRMGVFATDAVRTDLKRYGHEVIELERFAMSNKIWQDKVKRGRFPDLVCVRCGTRIESRGKSQLRIIASDSGAEERSWDAGMRDDDLFAFLRLDMAQRPPHSSQPVYFRTKDLRAEVPTKQSSRKAASEGSELTRMWDSWTPTWSGVFLETDSEERLTGRNDNGRRVTYSHWLRWPARNVYLAPGDQVIANETMVAGVVAPPGSIECPGEWDLQVALSDADIGERYAAVKVAGVLGRSDLIADLVLIARDDNEWRLRLEAEASLARLDPIWLKVIAETAMTPTHSNEQRMEAVFALSEIPTDEAAAALAQIAADDGQKPRELRAAAVWGLARGTYPRPDLVLPHASDREEFVALHAIAGLPFLPNNLVPGLLEWLSQDDKHAAAAARLLQRCEAVRPLLTAVHNGGRTRLWALRALGDLSPDQVRSLGGELLTSEIEHDLEPIWIGREDWLRGPGAEGLEALDIQKDSFNPLLG